MLTLWNQNQTPPCRYRETKPHLPFVGQVKVQLPTSEKLNLYPISDHATREEVIPWSHSADKIKLHLPTRGQANFYSQSMATDGSTNETTFYQTSSDQPNPQQSSLLQTMKAAKISTTFGRIGSGQCVGCKSPECGSCRFCADEKKWRQKEIKTMLHYHWKVLWIELESDRTEDSLSTNDHYVEEQFTNPVWCYTEDITSDTDNGPKTDDVEQYLAWRVLVRVVKCV